MIYNYTKLIKFYNLLSYTNDNYFNVWIKILNDLYLLNKIYKDSNIYFNNDQFRTSLHKQNK
jgi:hypothetical protein